MNARHRTWHPAHSALALLSLALALALALQGCSTLQPTGSAMVGGTPVAYALAGQRGPAVVLQSGLGDDAEPWHAVFTELQTRRQVLAYDRPGYGHSATASGAAASSARDPCTVAGEQRALLQAVGLKPPYVLVGHSLGGLYQYVYARLYPEEVAGLVLLDPTHPDHWRRMQVQAPAAAASLKALRATVFSATARREFDQQADCLDRVAARHAHPVPTRVLVSTRASAIEGADFQNLVAELRTDWLRLSGASALQAVPGSGHYLQREAPAEVLRAIAAVPAAEPRP